MIHTILQIIAFQLFFLVIYDLFLKKETFFNWNRAYLLGTAILSMVLPFIKIDSFKEVLPEAYIFNFPNSVLNSETVVLDEITIGVQASKPVLTLENIFLFGAVVATILFVVKLFNVVKLIRNNPKHKTNKVLLIAVLNSNAAFSFFNYIFLGERIQPEEKKSIISHELIHVREKHSLDLLLFEVLRIVFWFNPLIYMYQNRVSDLHEFIADSKSVKTNKEGYYQNLLAQVFETKHISFINPFFKQSLIKKRISMLQKSRSKQVQLLKYALLIPAVIGMLVYSSCSDDSTRATGQDGVNLSQYSYSLKKGEELAGDKKEIHENYEAFLKSNPDYVAWAQINSDESEISYSVHRKDEEVPSNFSKSAALFPDDSSYVIYFNFTNSENDQPVSGVLLEKIEAVKEQIQIQGNISNEEEKGIALLVKSTMLTSAGVNHELIQDIQTYSNAQNKTKLHQKIVDLFDTIQQQGNITDEEEESLKTLLVLVSKEGLDIAFYNEVKDLIEIPFGVVDEVPTFPGCESNVTKQEAAGCFNQKMNSFVAKNFNTNVAKSLNLSGVQKISVFFIIDNEGNIVDVKARAPHPDLDEEAVRVINLLPKMTPGKQDGKAVNVPYYLPIKFQLSE
jgi:hypothetical protein